MLIQRFPWVQQPPSSSQLDLSGKFTLGLLGYWPLNENSGPLAHDYSFNKNIGALINQPAYVADRNGYILSLNGSTQYALLKNGPIISGLSTWSMCAWIKTTTIGIVGGTAIYAERAATGNDIIKLDSVDKTSPNNAFITIRNDGGTLLQVRGTKIINDNKWHFIVGTQNGTSVTLYVDGAVDATGTWSGTNTFTNSGLQSRIGADPTGSYFAGRIGNVSVFNRALSGIEVRYFYNAPWALLAP